MSMTNEELVQNIKQGDTSLMGELYEQNRRFIYAVVKSNGINPDNYEDAMQDAYFGLVEAVNGFDESMGYKFLTYAKYHIQVAIRRGQSNALHVPERVRVAARKIKRIQNKLALELNRMPTAAEMVKYTGLDIDTIKETLAAAQSVKSIYEPLAEDLTIGDTIEDKGIDFENEIAEADECRNVRMAVNTLPEAERQVIQCCYMQGLTLTETGQRLGMTPEQARKLKEKGLRYLRHPRITRAILGRELEKEIDDELDRRTSFYIHVGVGAFEHSRISATEQAVFDRERIQNEIYNEILKRQER